MNGQFQVDRGSCATTPEGFEANPAIEPNRPRKVWQFVNEFQQLVGEDSEPDIRFFMESWTSGTAAAVTSFQQRRQQQSEQEDLEEDFGDSEITDTISFTRDCAVGAEFSVSVGASRYARGSDACWPPRRLEEPSTRSQDEAWQEWESLARERGGSSGSIMTQQLAFRLLGVTEASTRKQLRAAYRKMVSRWHPDRLELGTQEMRQIANERMAAINEAYHLLLNRLR